MSSPPPVHMSISVAGGLVKWADVGDVSDIL